MKSELVLFSPWIILLFTYISWRRNINLRLTSGVFLLKTGSISNYAYRFLDLYKNSPTLPSLTLSRWDKNLGLHFSPRRPKWFKTILILLATPLRQCHGNQWRRCSKGQWKKLLILYAMYISRMHSSRQVYITITSGIYYKNTILLTVCITLSQNFPCSKCTVNFNIINV